MWALPTRCDKASRVVQAGLFVTESPARVMSVNTFRFADMLKGIATTFWSNRE